MDLPSIPAETISHFRVTARLGMGGMGVVYRAEDLHLERPVALKVMRPEHVADLRRRERFLREARTAASLVHPNVATIYEVGESDGTIFIAMELVPGESLRAVLAALPGRRVEVRRALRWSVGIARALAHAHEAGIVHRDLKPDNVMVLPDGEVKLLDFGIAKWLEQASEDRQALGLAPTAEATVEGVMLGTPAYVSPEQARGEWVDVRSDVFSFGAMLYEMLSGIGPFHRGTALDTLTAVVRDTPAPLEEVAAGVPSDVAAIVARCLAKGATDRFASGRELLAALQGAQASASTREPRTAVPVPVAEHDGETRPLASVGGSTESTFGPPGAPRGEPRATPGRIARWVATVAAVGAMSALGVVAVRDRTKRASQAAQGVDAAVTVGPGAGCTSNAACVKEHGGEAWKCHSVRHECVKIASEDCTTRASETDLRAEDTVWLGVLLPTTGSVAKDIASERNAIVLARRDFNDALGGSVARKGPLHARPIALVVCDENADPVRAAHHLAENVEVPAVIGFRFAKTGLDTIPSVFLPSHVLSMISVSQAAVLAKIPEAGNEPRLIWRTTLDVADVARPLAALVSEVIEPRARAAGLGSRPLQVAYVRSAAAIPRDDPGYFRELKFNGRSALENGEAFRQYVLDGTNADNVIAALVEFAPNVIVFQGQTIGHDIIAPLEEGWRRRQRPIYVTGSDLPDDIIAFAGESRERRARFFGLTNVSSTMTNAELVLHYNFAYPKEEPIVRTNAPQPSYDAFYVLGYAIEATGEGAITGPSLSLAIRKLLPPGERVEVGPAAIVDAFRRLRSGSEIDIVGAIGSLDFDPATGEAPIDYAVLCLGVSDRGFASAAVESGLFYDSNGRRFKGAEHCP